MSNYFLNYLKNTLELGPMDGNKTADLFEETGAYFASLKETLQSDDLETQQRLAKELKEIKSYLQERASGASPKKDKRPRKRTTKLKKV